MSGVNVSGTLVLLFALVAAGAANAGDIEKGKVASATCAACHGADGNSSDGANPKLAGQYESYLLQALKSYKSGERQNAIMGAMVGGLNLQQMEDLAAYFASQESPLRAVTPK